MANPRAQKDDLTAHWQDRLPAGVTIPWGMAWSCWRCGLQEHLQRCHLVPASRGGQDEPANLIRLCDGCHREQPNVEDAAHTWRWLAATQHDGSWRRHTNWIDAYEAMYGERPAQHYGEDDLPSRLKAELDAAAAHWGTPTLNPATLAACVRRAEGLPA